MFGIVSADVSDVRPGSATTVYISFTTWKRDAIGTDFLAVSLTLFVLRSVRLSRSMCEHDCLKRCVCGHDYMEAQFSLHKVIYLAYPVVATGIL